jgi:predicted lipoprotein with Yx(FWY)xxD motif
MTSTKRITSVAFAAVPLVALAVAGCGGSSSSGPPPAAAATPPKTPVSQAVTVRVAKRDVGTILVDAHGRTLYLFKQDTGTKSTCTGACAQAWPPLHAAGTPTVDSRAKSSLLGASQRSDGTRQVTYNGHPLYTFQGDHKRGDTKGEGVVAFGAGWFAVSPAGKAKAAPKPKPTPPQAPKAAPKKAAPSNNGIPQNNGGDQDSDNNGGPDDGDGGI